MGFGPNIALELQDVSQGGARVLCRDALPVGTEVELELMGLNHARAVKTLATVIRCESFGSAHSLAVQFEHQLGYPDLARMT
jgi:hypothetical protein